MIIPLLHRRPALFWPLLAASTALFATGLFVLAWTA
jgi:hypothetical protein